MGELWWILVKLSIIFIIIALLILWLSDLWYFIWLLVWWFNSLFNSFQYIGADCSLIQTVKSMFVWVPIVLLILLIYKSLKN